MQRPKASGWARLVPTRVLKLIIVSRLAILDCISTKASLVEDSRFEEGTKSIGDPVGETTVPFGDHFGSGRSDRSSRNVPDADDGRNDGGGGSNDDLSRA